jgi:hypothetical protein
MYYYEHTYAKRMLIEAMVQKKRLSKDPLYMRKK